jgi:hypothetical protein
MSIVSNIFVSVNTIKRGARKTWAPLVWFKLQQPLARTGLVPRPQWS